MKFYLRDAKTKRLYPPTPAICRGSAPEKKWLCGALGGPAACPLATCRVLSLGGPAACSLATCRALSLTFSPGHLPGAFPWRPSSMSFGHLPGAFLDFFSWLQKATLGTRLRPCQRLFRHSGGSSLASTASLRPRQRLLRHSGRFPRIFLMASESFKCSAAPLPKTFPAFLEAVAWLQLLRCALAGGILEAVAWLQLLRCALAGSFCGILGAFQELF